MYYRALKISCFALLKHFQAVRIVFRLWKSRWLKM